MTAPAAFGVRRHDAAFCRVLAEMTLVGETIVKASLRKTRYGEENKGLFAGNKGWFALNNG